MIWWYYNKKWNNRLIENSGCRCRCLINNLETHARARAHTQDYIDGGSNQRVDLTLFNHPILKHSYRGGQKSASIINLIQNTLFKLELDQNQWNSQGKRCKYEWTNLETIRLTVNHKQICCLKIQTVSYGWKIEPEKTRWKQYSQLHALQKVGTSRTYWQD